MNAVSTVTLSLSAIYLLIGIMTFGLTESISATFYTWQKRNYSAAFFWFCLVVCGGAWLQLIYELKTYAALCLFLAGASIAGVGIAATYRDKKVTTIHYVFAAVGIALGFAALSIQYWGEWRAWVPLVTFIVLTAGFKLIWPRYVIFLSEWLALWLIMGLL